MKYVVAIVALLFQGAQPTFEVASIKPSSAETNDSGGLTGNGSLRMRNVTLKRCIRAAYGVPEDQVLGGPKWADENRYDIEAKAAGREGDSEMMPMLRTLLADRFKLTLHRETRQLSGYGLVVAKGGLKIKPSAADAPSRTNSRRGGLDAEACTMGQLALKLALALHQPVEDSTGLKSAFDFKLEWTPDDMQAKAAADGAQAPSIFSAVQEQLGLRLESRKVPADVLVIDRAEEPSAN